MDTRYFMRLLIVSALTCTAGAVNAQKPEGCLVPSGKIMTIGATRPLLINHILNYYSNNGSGSYNTFSQLNEGFEYPKGLPGCTLIYEDGVVWGCFQSGVLKVGGSTYRHALQPGPILVSGSGVNPPVADDPVNPANRVYRVRHDLAPISGVTDPDDAKAERELGLVSAGELPFVGFNEGSTAEQLLQQYWDDWNAWPAAQGAPFTDVDKNGSFDPAVDIPGEPLANQTLWYVANDLNPALTQTLAGSAPIGVEMQKTIWAYNTPGALSGAHFARTRLINKSGVQLDSMFLAQWSDPDVGDAGNDLAGCDTVLDLGYAYNGTSEDPNYSRYGLAPPAVGYALLQGPVVNGAAGDSAIFGSSYRIGYRNLRMSSFSIFFPTAGLYSDPVLGAGGDVQWYRLLNGVIPGAGSPYLDPTTGLPTRFCAAGDPVSDIGFSGWVDGTFGMGPLDRKIDLVTGPFSMTPGDTQEVVVACLAADGDSQITSVSQLKASVRDVRKMFRGLLSQLPPPISCDVRQVSTDAVISFRAEAGKALATGVTMLVRNYAGGALASATLVDDGLHQDGVAGDGIFGGSVQIPQQVEGLLADAVVSYAGGEQITWSNYFERIATARVFVSAFAIASDNINSDGTANPGENIRYVFSLTNASGLTLHTAYASGFPSSLTRYVTMDSLPAMSTRSLAYDPYYGGSYLDFTIPAAYADSVFTVALTVTNVSQNEWRDTLRFPVKPLPTKGYATPLVRSSGRASGDFVVRIIDSAMVKNHLYVIRGVDREGGGYSVKDSTAGVMLLSNQPMPDSLGHTSPLIDGFKILPGTVDARQGMKSWSVPQGTLRFSPLGGFSGLGLEGFPRPGSPTAYETSLGTIGMAGHFAFGGIGTTLTGADYHSVLLKLAAVDNVSLWDPKSVTADPNFSRAYRYLRASTAASAEPSFTPWIINVAAGYPYQDYNVAVPFSAWDIDVIPPMRLAVGMFENNVVGGFVDGRYWPDSTTGDNSVSREFAFVFKSPYTGNTPDPALQVNMVNNQSTPLMWVMTCARAANEPWVAGDQFQINAYHSLSAADMWTFNPTVVLSVPSLNEPTGFALNQNYPNPFNPSTTIEFSIKNSEFLFLKVYDVLGREVVTLVNGRMESGAHSVTFNARNIASGVYFYRLQATGGGKSYVATKKMMVIK